MVRTTLGLMLAFLVNTAAADAATLLYGSAYGGPGFTSTLWVFTPTGQAHVLGQIGFGRVGSLDFSPGGTLYGVGQDATRTVLITINTTTGAGTLVGPLGPLIGNFAFQDIAFRPSDGTLFGFSGGSIFTINTTTGAATLVGDAGVGFPFGNSLAFQGTTLYYANETALYTIDQVTGVATFVRNLTYQPVFGIFPRPPAMKFDPVSPTLWSLVVGVNGGFHLARIDVASGQVTRVEGAADGMDGLAVTIGDLPAFGIPTLAGWVQVVLVGVLIVAGLEALRRRRPSLG